MKLFSMIRRFRDDKSGAVTVDWVVLTAAVVGLGIGVIVSVEGGVDDLAGAIGSAVGSISVDTN